MEGTDIWNIGFLVSSFLYTTMALKAGKATCRYIQGKVIEDGGIDCW
jgi:hypothetical protein